MTQLDPSRISSITTTGKAMTARSSTLRGLLCTISLLLMLAGPSTAQAAFGLKPGLEGFDGAVLAADGYPDTQAGGHPYEASTTIKFNTVEIDGWTTPDESVRDIHVDLPPGFVGNPKATPTRCTAAQLNDVDDFLGSTCPGSSQVGILKLVYAGTAITQENAIYNMVPPPGVPAMFGATPGGVPALMTASLRTGGDYGLTVDATDLPQVLQIREIKATLWGVPADSRHDGQRCDALPCNGPVGHPRNGPSSVDGPKVPFLRNPTSCTPSGVGVATGIRLRSWAGSLDSSSFTTHMPAPDVQTQIGPTGCGKLPFDPSLSLQPDSTAADSPSGLAVDLSFPHNDGPNSIDTADLKRAQVTLPEGITINPAAAGGLEACSDEQIGLDSAGPAKCPDASKIGSVEATTPLLDETLSGGIHIGEQKSSDPESGQMFRMLLLLENEQRGLRVKLAGSIKANAQTGRLETTFDDNPQLPVSNIRLRFKGGPRAPLATPPTCGPKTVDATLTSWGGQVAHRSDTFTIDCPGLSGFAPAFSAGSASPLGGAFSPFLVRVARDDRQEYIDGVSLAMPPGLVAKLKGVPLCADAQAAAGTCPEATRVGTATVGAGPGASPFFLSGSVSLTEGYKNAPYGLSVAVPAKAGPFDLGLVVVRQAIHVDPTDARLTVVSDPLPTIVKGVPVRLRSISVDVDRPDFTVNPSSCSAKPLRAVFHSQQGSFATQTTTFQASGCKALAVKPKLKLALTGRKQLTDGGHPGLKATLTQGAGQAGLRRVAVKLPLSLALDPENAESDGLCSFEESRKADPKCPASSIVGRAKAWTPLLNEPLEGPVFFSKNVRRDPKSGRQIRTLPTLVIPLRGEVALNLVGESDTSKAGKLVNTFATVPDAPVSKFELTLKGGKRGILVVNGRACKRSRTAIVEVDGQNGKTADQKPTLAAPCAKKATKRKRR